MPAAILIIGSVCLGALYLAFGPTEIDNFYLTVLPIEGAAFSALIILAFRPMRPLNLILVILITAAANTLLAFGWAFLMGIPMLAADRLELSDTTKFAVSIGWLAMIGALFFCAILDFMGRLSSISARTYYLAMALVPFSAVPFLMSSVATLAFHKTLWWLCFSAALILTCRREPADTATTNVA